MSGSFDSESFECGSPFMAAADDGGYGGTEAFAACDQERRHMRWVALGSLTLGTALVVSSATSVTARRESAPPRTAESAVQ